MATPMSARRSAGASLTPSPVIATTWPSLLQRGDDVQLLLRLGAGEDAGMLETPVIRLDSVAPRDLVTRAPDAQLSADRRGGGRMVPGDRGAV